MCTNNLCPDDSLRVDPHDPHSPDASPRVDPSNPNSPGDDFIIIDYREAAHGDHADGALMIDWQPDPALVGDAGEFLVPAVQAESFRPTESLLPAVQAELLLPAVQAPVWDHDLVL